MVRSAHEIANDYFSRLKKELGEMTEDPKDRTFCVLTKNIEVALEQKKLAADEVKKLKNSLANDHSIEVIKEEMDKLRKKKKYGEALEKLGRVIAKA